MNIGINAALKLPNIIRENMRSGMVNAAQNISKSVLIPNVLAINLCLKKPKNFDTIVKITMIVVIVEVLFTGFIFLLYQINYMSVARNP